LPLPLLYDAASVSPPSKVHCPHIRVFDDADRHFHSLSSFID